MSDTAQRDTHQYLTFVVAGEEYAVDILKVQEIRGWSPVTAIPNTPNYICGVLNLRGAIVPVVDMRLRFQSEAAPYTATTVIVLVNVSDHDRVSTRTVGLVADAVSDVHNIDASEIQSPPDLTGAIDTDFVHALVTVGEKMIIVLNIDELVTDGLLNGPGFGEADDKVALASNATTRHP